MCVITFIICYVLLLHSTNSICERSHVTNMAASEVCSCTDVEQFSEWYLDGALPCEFELITAGDVEWLLFSYT